MLALCLGSCIEFRLTDGIFHVRNDSIMKGILDDIVNGVLASITDNIVAGVLGGLFDGVSRLGSLLDVLVDDIFDRLVIHPASFIF